MASSRERGTSRIRSAENFWDSALVCMRDSVEQAIAAKGDEQGALREECRRLFEALLTLRGLRRFEDHGKAEQLTREVNILLKRMNLRLRPYGSEDVALLACFPPTGSEGSLFAFAFESNPFTAPEPSLTEFEVVFQPGSTTSRPPDFQMEWKEESGQRDHYRWMRDAKRTVTLELGLIPTPFRSPFSYLKACEKHGIAPTEPLLDVQAARQGLLRSVEQVAVLSERALRNSFVGTHPGEQVQWLLRQLRAKGSKLSIYLVLEEAWDSLPDELTSSGFILVEREEGRVLLAHTGRKSIDQTFAWVNSPEYEAKQRLFDKLLQVPGTLTDRKRVVAHLERLADDLLSDSESATLLEEAAKARIAELRRRVLRSVEVAKLARGSVEAQEKAARELEAGLQDLAGERLPAREARSLVAELDGALRILNRSLCCPGCKQPADLHTTTVDGDVRFEFVHLGEPEPHAPSSLVPRLSFVEPTPTPILEDLGLGESAIKKLVAADDHEEVRKLLAAARQHHSLDSLQHAFTYYQIAIDGVSYDGHPGWELERKREIQSDFNTALRSASALAYCDGRAGYLTVTGGGSGTFQLREPGRKTKVFTIGQVLPLFRLIPLPPPKT